MSEDLDSPHRSALIAVYHTSNLGNMALNEVVSGILEHSGREVIEIGRPGALRRRGVRLLDAPGLTWRPQMRAAYARRISTRHANLRLASALWLVAGDINGFSNQSLRIRQLERLAQANGCPAALVNAQLSRRSPLQPIIREAVRRGVRVMVRDEESGATVKHFGGRTVVVPDAAFMYQHQLPSTPNQRCGAGLVLHGPSIVSDRGQLAEFVDTARALERRWGRVTLLISDPVADRAGLALLHSVLTDERVPHFVSPTFRSPDKFVEKISEFEILVSGRMHPSVLALGAGVPCVLLDFEEGKGRRTWSCAGISTTPVIDASTGSWYRQAEEAEPAVLAQAEHESVKARIRQGWTDFLLQLHDRPAGD